jgi:hypothetical protein
MEKLALHLQKLTGYKIIRINGKFYDHFDRKMQYILDAGPQHWLYLFEHASFILAKSFHATAFAINFRRPFLSILTGKKDHDSRQIHLLNQLGLTSRAITIGNKFPGMADMDLHFKENNSSIEQLEAAKIESIRYLKKIIEN